MTKYIFLISGLLVLMGGVYFWISLNRDLKEAIALDKEETSFGMIEGPPLCTWTVTPPDRVISENKSQAIVVESKNEITEPCEVTISLRAPGFDISPNKEDQHIALEATSSGSLSWIVTPRKSGTYELAVSDPLHTQIMGVTVTNVFGLSAAQAKIASILGTLFGPMLTVPWWWDRLKRKPVT